MIDKTEIDLRTAGLLDDQETFRNLRGLHRFRGIWVPPHVELEVRCPTGIVRQSEAGSRYKTHEKQPLLRYPLPEEMTPYLLGLGHEEQEALKSIGWQCETNPFGLVDAFRSLARESFTSNVINAVRAFAEKWGPLWICRNADHQNCYFSFDRRNMALSSPCDWVPEEEPLEFVREAIRFNAVVEAIAILSRYDPPHENRTVPAAVWQKIGFPDEGSERIAKLEGDMQKSMLASIISGRLSSLRCMEVAIAWLHQGRASLHLSISNGFIREVWVQVTDLLCRASLYQCDGCGRYYTRTIRKPQAGRLNYCLNCGAKGKHKASKRQWAERSHRPTTQKPAAERRYT